MLNPGIAAAAVMTTAALLAPVAAAETFYVGGTGADSVATKPVDLSWINHLGAATQVGYPAEFIDMGSSIDTGVANLSAAVDGATGPVTIVGGSQGALVLNAYKQQLADDPNARTDITFVSFADPSSKYGLFGRNPGVFVPVLNVRTTGPVRGPYTTTVVSRQYDGAADWPKRQWNLLADANAVAGFIYLHPHYGDIDTTGMTPIEVDGNTTYYRIPTEHLPLLQPLRDLGVDQRLVNAVEVPLRRVIDSAYDQPKATTVARPQPVTGRKPTTERTRHDPAALRSGEGRDLRDQEPKPDRGGLRRGPGVHRDQGEVRRGVPVHRVPGTRVRRAQGSV